MNIIQFLILDSILRFASPEAASEADSSERALLFEEDSQADFSDDEENAVGRRSSRHLNDTDSQKAIAIGDAKILGPARAEVVLISSNSTRPASALAGSASSSDVVGGFSYPPPSITVTAPEAKSRRASASSARAVCMEEAAPPPSPPPVPAAPPPFALPDAAQETAGDDSFEDDWGFDDPEPDEKAAMPEKVWVARAEAQAETPSTTRYSIESDAWGV